MPKWWFNFMRRITAAQKAFQKPDVITDPLDLDADWNEYGSRRNRYDIFWAFYENTVFDETQSNFHQWASEYKVRYGMYKYTRNIYNPSHRLGEFWRSHIWAGPIETLLSHFTFGDGVDEDQLKEAINQIYAWSNWEIKKDIIPLYGSVMGDVGIIVVDDTEREKVFLDIVHPGNLVHVDKDIAGNVIAYQIEEERPDPRKATNQSVVYTEIAIKVDQEVEYTTLLNGSPYPWNGVTPHWTKPYGFVPMVTIQHNDVGLLWGWSEILPGQSKFREVDDVGSKLNDQIRKMVDSPWLFSGVSAPTDSPTASETSLTGTAAANRPQPGREEVPIFYGPENASATPLVADLEIGETSSHIDTIITDIEKDYPELRLISLLNEDVGPVSGRALEAAKQPAIKKVQQRRPNYYSALIRANMMAVTIAGFNGYNAYNLDSFDQGELDHNIMDIPIFTTGEFETQELLTGKIANVKTLTDAGASLEQAAILAGFTQEEALLLSQVDLSILER
jgi:hypothetical protein